MLFKNQLTFLPLSKMMELQRTWKSCFLEENLMGTDALDKMSEQSDGKKLSQTISESAMDRKEEETKESLHASCGEVSEQITEKQSSGNMLILYSFSSAIFNIIMHKNKTDQLRKKISDTQVRG